MIRVGVFVLIAVHRGCLSVWGDGNGGRVEYIKASTCGYYFVLRWGGLPTLLNGIIGT